MFYSALVATIISALMNSFIAVNFSGMLKLNIPEIKYEVSQHLMNGEPKGGESYNCYDTTELIKAANFVYDGNFPPYKLNSLWKPPYTDDIIMRKHKPALQAWLGYIGLCDGFVLNATAPYISPVVCIDDEDYLLVMEMVLAGEFSQFVVDPNIFGGSAELDEITFDIKRELFFRQVCFSQR